MSHEREISPRGNPTFVNYKPPIKLRGAFGLGIVFISAKRSVFRDKCEEEGLGDCRIRKRERQKDSVKVPVHCRKKSS